MNKWLVLPILPFTLMACAPDSDGGGDANQGSKLVIDANNKDAMIQQALPRVAIDDTFDDPFTEFQGFLLTGDDASSKSLSARAQDSVNCDSGSATVTANTADIDASVTPENGSASFSASYNSCVFSSTSPDFSFSMTIDGSISANLEWTGYQSGSEEFDTVSMDVDIDNFSYLINMNGEEAAFEMDFAASMSFDDPIATYSYSGTFGVDGAGEGVVSISTVSPMTVDTSQVPAYPSSGEVVMNGGNGSSIRYTVVPDGVEVSVNGGQAELYTWKEIETM